MGQKNWLEQVAELHKDWIKAAKAYGANDFAEDIVQDTYIKLHKYANADKVINNGHVNKGYVFFTLKTVIADYHKRKPLFADEPETTTPECLLNIEKEIAWHKFCIMIDDYITERVNETGEEGEFKGWSLGDKIVFNTYRFNKTSMRKIAQEKDVSWVSIFHQLKGLKTDIKDNFLEDYQDLINGDYDKIR